MIPTTAMLYRVELDPCRIVPTRLPFEQVFALASDLQPPESLVPSGRPDQCCRCKTAARTIPVLTGQLRRARFYYVCKQCAAPFMSWSHLLEIAT